MISQEVQAWSIDFNKIINKLLRKLTCKGITAEIDRLKKRVRIVINATPLVLLEDGSPHLWSHRKDLKKIYQSDDTYDWSVCQQDFSHHWSDDKDGEAIGKLVDLIKNAFINYPEAEKIDIYDDVIDAVSIIAQYRKYCKENGISLK